MTFSQTSAIAAGMTLYRPNPSNSTWPSDKGLVLQRDARSFRIRWEGTPGQTSDYDLTARESYSTFAFRPVAPKPKRKRKPK